MPQNPMHFIYQSLLADIRSKLAIKSPIIVGITGPMGIGKSSFSAGLKAFLLEFYPSVKSTIINTDGFLFPNEVLKSQDTMKCKGFPVSFNQEVYELFLQEVLQDKKSEHILPFYNHLIKDIDATQKQVAPRSDIYIVEGINLFFGLEKQEITNSSGILPSPYALLVLLQMDERDIRAQCEDRFDKALQYSQTHKTDYFKALEGYTPKQIADYKQTLWETIHLPFVQNHIAPFAHFATHTVDLPHLGGKD